MSAYLAVCAFGTVLFLSVYFLEEFSEALSVCLRQIITLPARMLLR